MFAPFLLVDDTRHPTSCNAHVQPPQRLPPSHRHNCLTGVAHSDMLALHLIANTDDVIGYKWSGSAHGGGGRRFGPDHCIGRL